jgi:hypothetical protein
LAVALAAGALEGPQAASIVAANTAAAVRPDIR